MLRAAPTGRPTIAHHDPASPAPASTRSGVRLGLSALGGALGVAALYVWDDALFAAPIVAASAWAGPAVAFVVFSVIYTAGSFVLALLAVRAYDRFSRGEPSRLQAWLEARERSRRGGWGRRLLGFGRFVGFVASSFVLGGILTTWLVRYGGRREGIARVALASSAIFGVTFTAFYLGIVFGITSL